MLVGILVLSCMLTVEAANVELRKVVFSPEESSYFPGQVLSLFLDIVNNEGKPFRNFPVQVSVDGKEVYSGVIDLNGSKTETVRILSGLFDRDWNTYECGTKEFVVRLPESQGNSYTADFRISGKKFKEVSVSPQKINPRNYTEITVLDERGIGHPAAKVKLTNLGADNELDKDDESYLNKTWGGLMQVILSNEFKNPFGRYQVDVWAPVGYCEETSYFEVLQERSLFASLEPPAPRPFEYFRVKVVDEKGEPVSYASVNISGNVSSPLVYMTDSEGLVYLTLKNPGEYIVSAEKGGYINYSTGFFVSTIPVLSIEFPYKEALVGLNYSILVLSEGSVLDNVNVSVAFVNETFYFTGGSVSFVPPYPGEYRVLAQKENHVPAEASFSAFNKFKLKLIQLSWDKREAVIKAENQKGEPVPYANISMENTSNYGLTDNDGFVSFTLPLADLITFKAEKEDGFKGETLTVKPNKTLYLEVNPQEIKLGDKVSLTVRNDFGDNVISEIITTNPDGSREKVIKDKHVFAPDMPGEYFISASSEGYSPTSLSFVVNPRALELNVNVTSQEVIINTLDGNTPIGGLYVWIDTPTGMEYVITNSRGYATFKAYSDGAYAVYVNSTPYAYTRKSVYFEKKTFPLKKTALGTLVLAFSLVVALLFFIKKREEPVEEPPKKSALEKV